MTDRKKTSKKKSSKKKGKRETNHRGNPVGESKADRQARLKSRDD